MQKRTRWWENRVDGSQLAVCGIRDRPVRLMGGGVCNSTPVLGIFNTGVSKMIVRSFILKKEKKAN